MGVSYGGDERRLEEKEEVRKWEGHGCREREREEKKIRSLFPFPGHDMINRFLLI